MNPKKVFLWLVDAFIFVVACLVIDHFLAPENPWAAPLIVFCTAGYCGWRQWKYRATR